jgi:tetratricopeptide (TPR) repeat protein
MRYPPALACVVALVLSAPGAAQTPARGRSVMSTATLAIQEAFAAYSGGDDLAVERWLRTPQAVRFVPYLVTALPAEPGTWNRHRAAFFLEVAAGLTPTSRRLLALAAVRPYVLGRPAAVGADAAEDRFEVLWHQIAIGLAQGLQDYPSQRDHVLAIQPRFEAAREFGVVLETRFPLARAIATAGMCCRRLSSSAVLIVERSAPELPAPTSDDAIALFEQAATVPALRVESLVRLGVLQHGLNRHVDALATLERVPPGDADHLVGYVQHLTRGRVLDAMSRAADAAEAYAAARAHMPTGQLAGIGLAAALLRSGRADEAARLAIDVRRSPDTNVDVLLEFQRADVRFVGDWLAEIRRLRR